MRFTVTPDWKMNPLLRLVLLWFLLFAAVLWVTNGLLYFGKMGLTPDSVVAYYRGDESRFLQPRSYQGLLEITHFHVFAMGIFVMTLAHLVLFVPLGNAVKASVVSLAFGAALADEGAGWLVRFVAPEFAYLKIAAFLTLQTTLAFLVGAVLWAILTAQRNDYTSAVRDEDDD